MLRNAGTSRPGGGRRGRSFQQTRAVRGQRRKQWQRWQRTASSSLENAHRSLKDNRAAPASCLNSIASINKWVKVRQWLMGTCGWSRSLTSVQRVRRNRRETRPYSSLHKARSLPLQEAQRTVQHLCPGRSPRGLRERTSKRNVFFNPTFKINEQTFEIEESIRRAIRFSDEEILGNARGVSGNGRSGGKKSSRNLSSGG